MKFLYVVTHQIQAHTPLFRKISQNKKISFKVIYWQNMSKTYFDTEFNRIINWGMDMTSGFNHIFLFDKETDAGNVMTRTFCGTCGSHITEFTNGYPEHTVVHAGTLDDPTRVNPDSQCWTPRTLHWINDVGGLRGFEQDPEF